MKLGTRIRTVEHDDGLNAWCNARVAPPTSLAELVDGYSDYSEKTAGFTTRRELPHAEGVLLFNLGDPIAVTGGDGATLTLAGGEAFFAGAHLRPALSQSGGAQAGVHVFLPLATLGRLFRAPMHVFADRVVALDASIGFEARVLGRALAECDTVEQRAAILDETLTRLLQATPPQERRQANALRLLRHRPDLDITEIARQVGWSRKHLSDRVRDAVGVGPRCFRRLLRFQALTGCIDRQPAGVNWAALALDAGYFDQSHMIREFREFSGLTPAGYLQRVLPDGGGLVEV